MLPDPARLSPLDLRVLRDRSYPIREYGCSVCVDMHSRNLKKDGETDDRIFGVAAWRDNPSFNGEERAALALSEALTRGSAIGPIR